MKTLNSNNIQKSKRTLFFTLLLVMGLLKLNAQSTPEPPATPEPPRTTTGTTYSISVDNDTDKKSNSSVSIKNTNDYYKFRASFHADKNNVLRETLVKKLGRENLKIDGNTYRWIAEQDGEDIFECKLSKGQLRIYLDRNVSSLKFFNSIKELGEELKTQISGKASN